MKITNRVILTVTTIIVVSICLISFLLFFLFRGTEKEINSFIEELYETNINNYFNSVHYNLENILFNYSISYNMGIKFYSQKNNTILSDVDTNSIDVADFIYVATNNNRNLEIYHSNENIIAELGKNSFINDYSETVSNNWSFEKINNEIYFIVCNPIELKSNGNEKKGVMGVGEKITYDRIESIIQYSLLQNYSMEFYTSEEELQNINNSDVVMQKNIFNSKNELIAKIVLRAQNNRIITATKKIIPMTIGILFLALSLIGIVFTKLINKMKNLTFIVSNSLYDIWQGNYHKRIPMSGYIEFDRTSKMINKLVDEAEERIKDLEESTLTSINVLTLALEAKDPYTKGHSERVAEYSILIARKMNMNEINIEKLKKAALLHDIGKIGIKEDILNKPGKLSDEEYAEIKKHPSIAANILGDYDAFRGLKEIVISHHERFDGSGYPVGLVGKDIPIGGRILAVADTFDAITSDRVYRKGMTVEKAISIIKQEKGKQFDSVIVDAFISIAKDFNNENLHYEIEDI